MTHEVVVAELAWPVDGVALAVRVHRKADASAAPLDVVLRAVQFLGPDHVLVEDLTHMQLLPGREGVMLSRPLCPRELATGPSRFPKLRIVLKQSAGAPVETVHVTLREARARGQRKT